uniref:NADH dehydrogenase subunit 6 n=1 Tax=Resomia ornicephala TaxID=557396 RepID=UPI0026E17924|nr:NADH dehydrogenase subunit 6 [Resomia ornicephala]WJJ70070.1 NADH dehydrogenase subunit 6 [Resomia ornicephala]WJJ70082.1 NADH dehydrogenase subunit 6 [Resomia ornicephala]
MNQIMFFTVFFIIICCWLTILSYNPIHSVFWLVCTFVFCSTLLITFHLDFVPIMIVIIYIGAISILFLFVIMMLDIIDLKSIQSVLNILPFIIIASSTIILQIFTLIGQKQNKSYSLQIEWNFNNNSQILLIASKLYAEYFYPLLIISILLVIAMVGVIILTVEKKDDKKDDRNNKNDHFNNRNKDNSKMRGTDKHPKTQDISEQQKRNWL